MEARAATDSLAAQAKQGKYVLPIFLAASYVAVGDREAALYWFELAIDSRAFSMVYARQDPIWDSLRGEPRFVELLQRIRPAQQTGVPIR